MQERDKTKDLTGEFLQKMQEKINGSVNLEVRCNQLEKELEQSHNKFQKIMEGIACIIARVVERRDSHSIGHHQRVSKLAITIAREMKLSKDKIEGLMFASLVHDIGKVDLPIEIVVKPDKLFEIEFNLIKNHPKIGYEILKKVDFPWPVAEIIFQHHEKIDGSGYPRELKRDEILIEAKILCVADVVEAMSSYRSYRPAISIDRTLNEISENKDVLFEPEVVDACLKLFREKDFKFE